MFQKQYYISNEHLSFASEVQKSFFRSAWCIQHSVDHALKTNQKNQGRYKICK
jgi:hypothetical protein